VLGRGVAVVPHEVVGDELPAALERVEQGERPVRAGERERGVALDHGQATAGGGDRVAFAGVGLFPGTELVELGLEGGLVDDRGRVAGSFVMMIVSFGFLRGRLRPAV
jgi:hypothetical protein